MPRVASLPDSPGIIAEWAALPVALRSNARALRHPGGWPRYRRVSVLASVVGAVAVTPAAACLWRRRPRRPRNASHR